MARFFKLETIQIHDRQKAELNAREVAESKYALLCNRLPAVSLKKQLTTD
jgi:hypothetical protein